MRAKLLEVNVSIEEVAQVAIDLNAAEDSLAALPAANENVATAHDLLVTTRSSVEILVSQVRNLVAAKSAATAIVDDSDSLLNGAQRLVDSYQSTSQIAIKIALAFGLLLLLSLLMMVKAYVDDSRRRAEEAARINSQNQSAILRLMNEMGDLADGDLTVRATVTEDVTGAIADSLNYTTEEFRKLVSRIMRCGGADGARDEKCRKYFQGSSGRYAETGAGDTDGWRIGGIDDQIHQRGGFQCGQVC